MQSFLDKAGKRNGEIYGVTAVIIFFGGSKIPAYYKGGIIFSESGKLLVDELKPIMKRKEQYQHSH